MKEFFENVAEWFTYDDHISKVAIAGILSSALAFYVWGVHQDHIDEAKAAKEMQEYVPMVTADPNNSRLNNILWSHGPARMKALSDLHYKVALADKLDKGGMVEVDKDKILINASMPSSQQIDVLGLTADYVEEQARDHQSYGKKEEFNIGAGDIISCGKNCQTHKEILVPVP